MSSQEEKPEAETGKKGPRRSKEDETPIEELYDLSKPIPRVSKVLVRECLEEKIYDRCNSHASHTLSRLVFLS